MSDLLLFVRFALRLWREIGRADAKHGDWRGMDRADMIVHICGEIREVGAAAARNDVDGPHGMQAELVQVACTSYKFWREVSRGRSDACVG